MAYILDGDNILKVITKSEDVTLNSVRFSDIYSSEIYLSLMFDFKTNIIIENELFKLTGYFGKSFDRNYKEENNAFYITFDECDLPDKVRDNLFTITKYIEDNLTDIELEEDNSKRFLLKHKYLNKELESYLNIHRCYLSKHNRPTLGDGYNTFEYTAELSEGLLGYLKEFYSTDFSEFERVDVR